jgi:hypothetical protein
MEHTVVAVGKLGERLAEMTPTRLYCKPPRSPPVFWGVFFSFFFWKPHVFCRPWPFSWCISTSVKTWSPTGITVRYLFFRLISPSPHSSPHPPCPCLRRLSHGSMSTMFTPLTPSVISVVSSLIPFHKYIVSPACTTYNTPSGRHPEIRNQVGPLLAPPRPCAYYHQWAMIFM